MWKTKRFVKGQAQEGKLISDTMTKNICLLSTVVLILCYTAPIWLNKGHIVFSDIDFGAFDIDYIQRMLGIFNEKLSCTNFFNLSRLLYITPLYLLSRVATAYPDFLLKSLIVSCLLAAGIGMYKLCIYILMNHFAKMPNRYHYIGVIIPALYYAVNPWVAFRIQHVFLLPGYALYPWCLKYFIELFRLSEDRLTVENESKKYINLYIFKFAIKINKAVYKDIKTSIKLGFCIALGSASIHFFFFYVLTFSVLSIVIMLYNWKISKKFSKSFKPFFIRNFILWFITYLMCAYWLNTYVVALTKTNIEPTNVNVIDTLSMFSRYSNIRGIAYLISYWWPMFNLSTSLDIYFWIGGGALLALIIYITMYRFSRHFDITLLTITTLVVLALATGVDTPYLADLNVNFVTRVPVFGQIFRDPNKVVGLLAAYLAILLSFGVDRLLFLIRREGYSKLVQLAFIGLLIGMHFLYFRPFNNIFMNGYYSSVQVPQEYKNLPDEHYTDEGKIVWIPDMDNVTLSNGLSNYSWNKIESDSDLTKSLSKTVGDFHIYTDTKKTIFKNEGNNNIITYIYSFLQDVIDRTGGQHLGEFISWLGFNEVGFHNDVLKQEERQQFNKNVLDAQKGLELTHSDDIISLYKVKNAQNDTFKVDNNIFFTKGLYTSLYMLDNKSQFNIDTTKTGLLWGNASRQNYMLTDNDVIVADNKLDVTAPFIPTKYYVAPFNSVNSADAYTGWAKSLMKMPDWFWLIKSNNLGDVDYDYDYGCGFVYTYSPIKLNIPSYRQSEYEKNVLMTMQDIKDNFFTVENKDLFNITLFPGDSTNKDTVYGNISKGSKPSSTWQVARSKDMDIKNLGGKFIRIKVIVSGQNASSMHFKARFFDESGKELNLAYISGNSASADFTKTYMTGDALVPKEAVKMRIDLLCEQDTKRDTYFWIHDFKMFNISDMTSDNILEVPITSKSPSDKYRVFARTLKTPESTKLVIVADNKSKEVSLQNETNNFVWDDLGTLESKDNKLTVIPNDGITVLNTFIVIPVEEFDTVWKSAESKIKGKQADISISSYDYKVKTDFPILDLAYEQTFPNTIQGSLSIVKKGALTKDLEVLKDDNYLFSYTGNTSEAAIEVNIKGIDGSSNKLELLKIDTSVDRNFTNSYYDTTTEINKYYLTEKKNQTNAWKIYRYYYKPISLKKGKYTIEIEINSNANNMINKSSIHVMKPTEVSVSNDSPDYIFDSINMLVAPKEQDTIIKTTDEKTENDIFINDISYSKLWYIYSYDKIPVKKGQLIAYKASVQANGLKDMHSKLIWTNSNSVIQDSTLVESDERVDAFYKIVESPVDGYLVPVFLAKSDEKTKGTFEVKNIEVMSISEFSKIEGTMLISEGINNNSGSIDDNVYRVYNEAYNCLWKYSNAKQSDTYTINFIHNGFIVNKDEEGGTFNLEASLKYTYKYSMIVSIVFYCLAIIFMFLKPKEINDV